MAPCRRGLACRTLDTYPARRVSPFPTQEGRNPVNGNIDSVGTPTGLARWLARCKPYYSALVRFCGVVTTAIAVVSDVLLPVAPFALYTAIVLLVIGVAIPIVHAVRPLNLRAKDAFHEYWDKPIWLAVAVSFVMMCVAYHSSSQSPSGNGVLADNFPMFRSVQQDLGIIRSSVQAIERHTGEISDNTRQINEKMDSVKQETSADPRKELANLGVTWSVDSFVEAMMEGDMEKVRLFLAGGMKPDALHNGSSALLYALQPTLSNDPVALLEALAAEGFKLDQHLVDRGILDHWSSGSLPARFETELAPQGYTGGYWGGEFVGPALLWVTQMATYRTPSESDLAVIRYLVTHGADSRVALSYLDYQRDWLADTTPYRQVRPILENSGQ